MKNALGILLLAVFLLLTANVKLSQAQNAVSLEGVMITERESEAMPGFSWIEKDRLAAMARPGGKRDLKVDLAFLQKAGIEVLISLTEVPIPAEILEQYGMEGLHLPVKDFTPPTLNQIEQFLKTVKRTQEENKALGIHCTAGKGRTGTMVATYLVEQGLTAEKAIVEIRRLRPGSVETIDQEKRVAEFARLSVPTP